MQLHHRHALFSNFLLHGIRRRIDLPKPCDRAMIKIYLLEESWIFQRFKVSCKMLWRKADFHTQSTANRTTSPKFSKGLTSTTS
jgi:hypothetical protein